LNIRKELLINLLKIETISGNEKNIVPLLIEELCTLGFVCSLDDIGNLHAIRGQAKQYPLLNAHMDIVDDSIWGDDFLYGYPITSKNNYWYNNDKYNGYKYNNTTYKSVGYKHEETDEDAIDNVLDTLNVDDYRLYFTCDDCSVELCDGKNCGTTSTPCEDFNVKKGSRDIVKKIVKDWNLTLKDFKYDIDEPTKTEVINSAKPMDKFDVYEKNGCLHGTGERVLGGDDKCGIFIALELARLLPDMPFKILFTIKEEIGCVGISHFVKNNPSWFDDVCYSLTIDRRGGDNLLWSQLGTRSCSNDFASRLAMIGIRCGIPIKIEDGSLADVVHIRELVPESVNVSAGYYSPHSTDEYIKLLDVVKIIQWLCKFIKNEKYRNDRSGN
jgi:hypothetical protein